MPGDVPLLMATWLAALNRFCAKPLSGDEALAAYARLHLGFVHIHPFWDGNGRVARLLANLPLLHSGHLPVVIELKDRQRCIETLAAYQIQARQLGGHNGVWPNPGLESAFVSFWEASYEATRALLSQARAQQARRASVPIQRR